MIPDPGCCCTIIVPVISQALLIREWAARVAPPDDWFTLYQVLPVASIKILVLYIVFLAFFGGQIVVRLTTDDENSGIGIAHTYVVLVILRGINQIFECLRYIHGCFFDGKGNAIFLHGSGFSVPNFALRPQFLFIRIHTCKIDVLVSTMLQVEIADWQKATASPCVWLAHQKKNYQLHAKLTQIEVSVKAHLAKVNFDRDAIDMDVRYISEPEKVNAERRAMEEAAEAERKAIAKREAAKEKARRKAEEKKRIEDEKNRLIWPFLVQFVDDIRSGARKIR